MTAAVRCDSISDRKDVETGLAIYMNPVRLRRTLTSVILMITASITVSCGAGESDGRKKPPGYDAGLDAFREGPLEDAASMLRSLALRPNPCAPGYTNGPLCCRQGSNKAVTYR
jgi:hypothetical protein